MTVTVFTELREQQIRAGMEMMRRHYPLLTKDRDQLRELVSMLVDEMDSVPNPERAAARRIARAADDYVIALDAAEVDTNMVLRRLRNALGR